MLNRTPLTLLLLAGCLALPVSLHAQPTPDTLPPKREFRALWVASVNNLDFPSRPGLDAAAFQAEWEAVLKEMAEAHFNAVIVQLRPAGDALYPSKLAPWSAFLVSGQGQAPEFDFDPLDWMIRRTHDYGLEFHAWLNPLRGGLRPDTSGLAPWHPARLHPEWVVPYNNRLYFNPGLEPVRRMVIEVVEELVTHYDVDAVHFDDYFYPYKVSGQHFNDSLTYFQQHQPGQSVSDWRRQNIDRLIEGVSRKLRAVAPEVRFGVSPFGVWRNEVQDPLGSPTTSPTTAYDDLYANTLRWLENGWVDYVIPQLYWSTEDPANPFGRLLT
ncbi:MAG: glycoside hydrolase, partial [Bacteroidetes bacterium]